MMDKKELAVFKDLMKIVVHRSTDIMGDINRMQNYGAGIKDVDIALSVARRLLRHDLKVLIRARKITNPVPAVLPASLADNEFLKTKKSPTPAPPLTPAPEPRPKPVGKRKKN
ncbi:MAG: hypothetical protein LBU79_10310 [Planctomycetota bacterium]|jgi:hypothetical protein|nr:hypothetical protein [Planctomycetota bacterium]